MIYISKNLRGLGNPLAQKSIKGMINKYSPIV